MQGSHARLVVLTAIGLASAYSAVAAPKCTLAKVADLPIRLERNHLIVDGTINGQKIGVMLDTGSRTLVLRAAAVRLGLPRRDARNYRIFGVGGETKAEITQIDEFTMGSIVRKDWPILVAGEGDFGEGIAVVLGEEYLQRFDVEFDLAHRAVRLFQPKDCEGVSLAYWASAGASEVKIEPLSDVHPEILLNVEINGRSILALLDSGAATSVLDKSEAARLGVTPETPGVIAANGGSGLGPKSVDSWIGPFQSFTMGNETIKDTEIYFADLFRDAAYSSTGSRLPTKLDGLPSMLLGADFLRAHRILVAHSQRKIYFTYVDGPVFQHIRPPAPTNPPRPADGAKPGAG